MIRRKVILGVALGSVAVLLAVSPANGITSNGVPDAGEHPYVGAMVRSVDAAGIRCSGTMISARVFLTAAHCTAGLLANGQTHAYVTLDEKYTRGASTLMRGRMFQHPGYPGNQHDARDIAVIVLDTPLSLARYGRLPTAGLFDRMAERNGLKDQKFEAVGYGTSEMDRGPGGPTWSDSGTKRKALSEFNAINPTWLRLSQNQAKGDQGTCYGDSGGPNFLGSSGNLVAAITITGDVPCYATNVVYRLDTPSARDFLDDFVTVP